MKKQITMAIEHGDAHFNIKLTNTILNTILIKYLHTVEVKYVSINTEDACCKSVFTIEADEKQLETICTQLENWVDLYDMCLFIENIE